MSNLEWDVYMSILRDKSDNPSVWARNKLQQMADRIHALTAERDEIQRELRKAETESSMLRVECGMIAAERDEARRSLCECRANGACDSRDGDWFADDGRHILAREYAAERGWDCFKQEDDK